MSLFVALFSFVACNRQKEIRPEINENLKNQDNIVEKNGRLVFESSQSYYATSNRLAKLNPNELESWSKQYKIESLMDKSLESLALAKGEENLDDWDLQNMPPVLRSLLNAKGELQINDTIVWYHKGIKYYALTEEELKATKSNPAEKGKKYGKYSYIKQEQTRDKNQQNIPILNWTNACVFHYYPDGKYQLIFDIPGWSQQPRKFVNEMWSWNEYTEYPSLGYYYYSTTLYLRMKMEKKLPLGTWYADNGIRREVKFYLDVQARKMWNIVSFSDPYTALEADFGPVLLRNDNLPQSERLFTTDYWLAIHTHTAFQLYCCAGIGDGSPHWQVHIVGYINQRRDQNPTLYWTWDCQGNPDLW